MVDCKISANSIFDVSHNPNCLPDNPRKSGAWQSTPDCSGVFNSPLDPNATDTMEIYWLVFPDQPVILYMQKKKNPNAFSHASCVFWWVNEVPWQRIDTSLQHHYRSEHKPCTVQSVAGSNILLCWSSYCPSQSLYCSLLNYPLQCQVSCREVKVVSSRTAYNDDTYQSNEGHVCLCWLIHDLFAL